MQIVYKKVNDLIPYINNSRTHSEEQVNQIVASINEFGFTNPLLIDEKDNIIAGHGRLLASKKLKMEEVPCIVLSGLTEAQKKAYVIADNKMALNAGWDDELLKIELENLKELDFNLELTGFNVDELDDIFQVKEEQEVIEDDFDIEPPEEPKAKLGDIYQLGNHRLMCGDSTKTEDVEKLMNGNKADMVFTDPPYGVSYTGGMKIENGKIESNGKKQIKNDALDYEKLYSFLYDVFINLKNNTILKSAFYVFYAHSRTREFLNAFYDAGLKQRSIIIWHKTSGGFGDFMAQYMNAYEPCIYGSNGDSVNWYGTTNEKTVWDMDKEKKCDLHPTMKPIEIVARAINNSSKKDEKVLDLFGGSGSTLIACEQLNRNCYMMELDPKYVDVIIKRWEEFTGKKALLIKEGGKL